MIQSGKVSSQRDAGEGPGGEELAEHRLERWTGRVSSSSIVPVLRSSAHSRIADRRHQEQVEPGMEAEEGLQVGLAALEEVADVEGQRPSRATRKMTMKT